VGSSGHFPPKKFYVRGRLDLFALGNAVATSSQAFQHIQSIVLNCVVGDFTVASPIFTQVSKRQGRVRRWRSGIRHRVAVTHKGRLLSRSRIWGNSRKRHQPLTPTLRRMSYSFHGLWLSPLVSIDAYCGSLCCIAFMSGFCTVRPLSRYPSIRVRIVLEC
jgi:hypothetical protein